MISISDLTFYYKKKLILDRLSLTVKKGKCAGIAGVNGSGKSTLLAILAGALKPASGAILYDTKNALQHHKIFTRYVGYVPQENPLIQELTVKDNLLLWYAGSSYSLTEELQNGLLPLLGISDFLTFPVSKLSGGMKKRVSIAIALASHPPVLILDEPSAALDLACKRDIRSYLKAYRQQGGTLLLTTHEESELDLCDTLHVLKQGRLCPIPTTLRGNQLLKEL